VESRLPAAKDPCKAEEAEREALRKWDGKTRPSRPFAFRESSAAYDMNSLLKPNDISLETPGTNIESREKTTDIAPLAEFLADWAKERWWRPRTDGTLRNFVALRFDLPGTGKLTLNTRMTYLAASARWSLSVAESRVTAEAEDGVRHSGQLVASDGALHSIRFERGTPPGLANAAARLFGDSTAGRPSSPPATGPLLPRLPPPLRDPLSRDAGIGPECARRFGVSQGEIVRRRTAALSV